MLTEHVQYGWINLSLRAKCIRFIPKNCHGHYAVMKLSLFGCKTSENVTPVGGRIEDISLGGLLSWILKTDNQIILGASLG